MDNSLPFIQSLFCKQGLDNRYRFAAIITASHFVFIFLWLIFAHSTTFLTLLAALMSVLVFFTSKRRLQDAGLTTYWVWGPSLSFALASIILLNIVNSWAMLSFIPALFSASYLLSLPTRNNQQYTYGYAGPVDLSYQTSKSIHERRKIEPSIHGTVDQLQFAEVHHRPTVTRTQDSSSSVKPVSIEQWFTDHILSIKHIKVVAPALVSLAIMLVLLVNNYRSDQEQELAEQQVANEESASPVSAIEKLQHVVSMPDDFELASNEFGAIKLRWQADTMSDKTLWDIASASGDKSCTHLSFNQGNKYRSLRVDVIESGTYIATFSPLDSEGIVKDLAYKNTFTLCGYNFSLKGSQAVIGKHSFFGKWL